MKVVVNPKLCIGCGLCSELVPEVFELFEGKTGMISRVKRNVDLTSNRIQDSTKEATKACPTEAIKIN